MATGVTFPIPQGMLPIAPLSVVNQFYSKVDFYIRNFIKEKDYIWYAKLFNLSDLKVNIFTNRENIIDDNYKQLKYYRIAIFSL